MIDLDKHLAEQARARTLGMDYSEIRRILLSVGADGDDGISEGRAVELVREMALRAVDNAIADERDAVVAWLRAKAIEDEGGGIPWDDCELRLYANAIQRGEHRREEGA